MRLEYFNQTLVFSFAFFQPFELETARTETTGRGMTQRSNICI
jgi:hypothetical protein